MKTASLTILMKDRERKSFDLDAKQIEKIVKVGQAHGVKGTAQIVYDEELESTIAVNEINIDDIKMAELFIDDKSAFVWLRNGKDWDRYIGNGSPKKS